MDQVPAIIDTDPVFESYAPKMVKTIKVGQAFHSIGFDGERRVVNAHWATKRRSHLALTLGVFLMVPKYHEATLAVVGYSLAGRRNLFVG